MAVLFNRLLPRVAVCALRFLYGVTLGRSWPVTHIPYGKREKRLPTVLSVEEVLKILKAADNVKHRTLLIVDDDLLGRSAASGCRKRRGRRSAGRRRR